MKKPELILPAGSLDKLKIGYQYGGDVCYVGVPSFSLRARENQFNDEFLAEAIKVARDEGKKIYVTTNIYPHNAKIKAFEEHVKKLAKLKPDALICADPGVISIVKEHYPDAKIHLSVQANAMNYRSVKFWKDLGISRVILPRELTIDEIKEIREQVPDIELECFVHGAICVAYSGRCLMSAYMLSRDSNQGACAHSCRWKYKILEEAERPGEYMPVYEDEQGTYLFNSKDLCALPYLKELMDAGVCGFKVEGRSKTVHYLATIAKVYRKAIDDMCDGKPFNKGLMDLVNKTANRSFIPGYLKKPFGEDSIYYPNNSPQQSYQFIGVVREHGGLNRDDLYGVELKNRIEKGNKLEIMTPDSEFTEEVTEICDLEGETLNEAHGGTHNVYLKLKEKFPSGAIIRKKL
ncbi:MAG: U32 family peptidase C-terminal domain-containing protein [Patescibacteria group bacterium]